MRAYTKRHVIFSGKFVRAYTKRHVIFRVPFHVIAMESRFRPGHGVDEAIVAKVIGTPIIKP